jgi:MFS family permease
MRTATTSERPWGYLELLRLGAFGFGITGFYVAMDAVVLPVLVLGVAPEGAKNTFLGSLGFSGMIVAAVAQSVVGLYSDRTRSPLGRRVPYMIWGTAFVCLGLAGLGFIASYLSLLVLWLAIQANASIGYGPFQAVIRDLIPASRIGIASSIKILADAAGAVTLVAISSSLLAHYSGADTVVWLWLSLGAIGVSLITTAAISIVTIRARERTSGSPPADSQVHLLPKMSLHPQLRWFVASRFLLISAIAVFPTYGLFFLRDVVQVANPTQTLGTSVIAVGGALALTVYPAGWVSDRVGRKPVVIVGAVAAAVSNVTLLAADTPTQVVIISSAIGAAVGVVLSANWALANELGTAGREGQHMGIVNLATVGGVAAAKILGPGVDLINLTSPGAGYTALLIACAVFFVLGALMLLPVVAEAPREQSQEGRTRRAAS